MTYSVDLYVDVGVDVVQVRRTVESVSDYYPYGKALRSYGRERYQSTYHERDLESGFDYRGARFYDSDVGRFNSLDPHASDYASWSDYSYVLGNPVNLIDPEGKDPITPRVYITDYTDKGLDMNLIGEYIQEIYAKNGFNIDIKIITPEQAFKMDLQQGEYGIGVVDNSDDKGYYQNMGRSYPMTGTTEYRLAHQDDTGEYRATQYVNYPAAIKAYPNSDKSYVISYLMSHEILHQMLIQAAAHHGLDLNDISTPYGGTEPNFGNLYRHYNDVPNLNRSAELVEEEDMPKGRSKSLRLLERILDDRNHKCLLKSFFSDLGDDISRPDFSGTPASIENH